MQKSKYWEKQMRVSYYRTEKKIFYQENRLYGEIFMYVFVSHSKPDYIMFVGKSHLVTSNRTHKDQQMMDFTQIKTRFLFILWLRRDAGVRINYVQMKPIFDAKRLICCKCVCMCVFAYILCNNVLNLK